MRIGDVYHVEFDLESSPPKPKFFLVVGVSADGEDIATVYINTCINFNIIDSPELKAHQFKIEPRQNLQGIIKSSHADCSDPKLRNKTNLERGIVEGSIIKQGALRKVEMIQIRQMLCGSNAIKRYYIMLFQFCNEI